MDRNTNTNGFITTSNTMKDVIERGNKLDELEQRTDELERQAAEFKRGTVKLRKHLDRRQCVLL